MEIQEPTVIRDAAVLMALNSALEPDGSLNLPTRIVHRHPDFIAVITTNCGYNGYRPLNEALRIISDRLLNAPQKTKLIISISDGQPKAMLDYTGEKAAYDMKDTLQEFRRKGIQFLAAAFCDVCKFSGFGKNAKIKEISSYVIKTDHCGTNKFTDLIWRKNEDTGKRVL